MQTPITIAQQAILVANGYDVEHLADGYGPEFTGQYRWVNPRHEDDDGDGFGVIQYSEDDAWADALQFQEQELGIPVFAD